MSQAVELDAATIPEPRRRVIVGSSKPLMNYVTACITMFNAGADEVLVRARGRAINPAVDVVELLRRRFMREVQIHNVAVDGEKVTLRDGRERTLPVLEILLARTNSG